MFTEYRNVSGAGDYVPGRVEGVAAIAVTAAFAAICALFDYLWDEAPKGAFYS